MINPFESPAKQDLRGRCAIAIDAAGHQEVAPLEVIPFPEGTELKGAIKGDFQSLDSDSIRYIYYLRPDGSKAIPQWLVNIAQQVRAMVECRLYVVVEESSLVLEKSCQTGGAGLLRISSDDTFDHVIEAGSTTENEVLAEIQSRAKELRRRMEAKLELKKNVLKENYQRASDLTGDMPEATREDYVSGIEQALERWSEWGDNVSAKLDEAVALVDLNLLDSAESLIEAGAIAENDVDPGSA